MAERTGIEWADATWNPWMGCRKVSPGCKNCYMFRDMTFYGRDPNVIVRAADSTFRNPLKWAKNEKLKQGARIFTCSWSDWFIDKADGWRKEAWRIVKMTPFTYLILTKRAERISDCLPDDWGNGYPNVWLIVSTENQQMLEKRWAELEKVPAIVRGLSVEPMLGEVRLEHRRPDWVITGGESDKKAPRKTELVWVRSLRDECIEHGIPFFHKQHGGTHKVDGAWGSRKLDGVEWNQFPAPPIFT